jgi:polar amino acid transport system substrate-binding protein
MKLRLSVIISLLILTILAFPACNAEAANKIVVATDASSRPFEFVNIQTDTIDGFDIDLFNAIAAREGLEAEYVDVQFDSLLAGLADCEYDAAISSITITEARKKDMLFSEPYFTAGQVVVVRKDNVDVNSKYDLGSKLVGVQVGTTGSMEAQTIAGAEIKEYDDIAYAYNDLIKGDIEAVIYDNSLAQFFINTNPDVLKAVGTLLTDENYGIAVCKDNKQLLNKINNGLKAVQNEGTIDSLIKKWIGG